MRAPARSAAEPVGVARGRSLPWGGATPYVRVNTGSMGTKRFVLRPGGRFAVSDIVIRGEFDPEIRQSIEAWIGCVAGALLCFSYGFGGNGLWMGMTLGLATAAVLLTIRFHFRVNREKRNAK